MSVYTLAENITLAQTWKFLKPKEAVYKVKIFCAFLTDWVIGSFLSSANIYLLCTVYYAGEGNGAPLQYSCLENPRDRGAWWAAVHGVAKSRTQLSDFTFTHWRRKWESSPVFLPGESQGWGSLVGCHLWGHAESDMTEWLSSSSSSVLCIRDCVIN